MQKLQTFTNTEFGELKVLIIDGKEMFPAIECARILGYSNSRDAIIRHCKSEGVVFHDAVSETVNQHKKTTKQTVEKKYILEGDLYRLIVKSKLPSAVKFEKWVMEDVLPQVRKTGGYIPISQTDTDHEIMARAILIANKTIQEKDSVIAELEPKAIAYDVFLKTNGYVSFNKVAKSLQIGRNKLMKQLRSKKILFKDGDDNIPYQRFINNGCFTVNHAVSNDGNIHSTTKVSPKGIEYIYKVISASVQEVSK